MTGFPSGTAHLPGKCVAAARSPREFALAAWPHGAECTNLGSPGLTPATSALGSRLLSPPDISLPSPGPAAASQRRWPLLLLKILVTTGLLTWLLASGTVDARSLGLLLTSPAIAAATVGLWLLATLPLCTLRWLLILRMIGARIGFARGAALQASALFFNSAVPGNMGGDILKNVYALKKRPVAIPVAAIVERFSGLVGLLWAGMFLGFPGLRDLDLHHSGQVLARSTLWLAGISSTILFGIAYWMVGKKRHSVGGARLLFRALGAVSECFPDSSAARRYAVLATLTSVLMHVLNLFYFWLVTRALVVPSPALGDLATIFPLGMITVVLPISISGLGVGHAAFEQLFQWQGLSQGATVFNVFIVGLLAPNLLGAIPYLLLRREKPGAPAVATETEDPEGS